MKRTRPVTLVDWLKTAKTNRVDDCGEDSASSSRERGTGEEGREQVVVAERETIIEVYVPGCGETKETPPTECDTAGPSSRSQSPDLFDFQAMQCDSEKYSTELEDLRVECDIPKILSGLSNFEIISLVDGNETEASGSANTEDDSGASKFVILPFSDGDSAKSDDSDVKVNALRKLTRPLTSWTQIKDCISSYGRARFGALQLLFESALDEATRDEYLLFVVPFMANIALNLPRLITKKVPMLERGCERAVVMTEEQAACLLANAFFCTIPRYSTTRSLPMFSCWKLFDERNLTAVEKLRCIFAYFQRIYRHSQKDRLLIYRRQSAEAPCWKSMNDVMLQKLVVLNDGKIEDEGCGMLQVDFANQYVGGGVLEFGCVQEEIRFLICPELLVAMLLCERMDDTEAVVVSGVQRFSDYCGYGGTFRWRPRSPNAGMEQYSSSEVVAIDAKSYEGRRRTQYSVDSVNRELNKAYAGFRLFDGSSRAIATGHWGCGVFRGDPQLKSLIQLMAASAHSRPLCFFTFGGKKFASELTELHDLLQSNGVSVGRLYEMIVAYCGRRNEDNFLNIVHLFNYIESLVLNHLELSEGSTKKAEEVIPS